MKLLGVSNEQAGIAYTVDDAWRTVGRVKDCLKGIFLKDRLPASCAF